MESINCLFDFTNFSSLVTADAQSKMVMFSAEERSINFIIF